MSDTKCPDCGMVLSDWHVTAACLAIQRNDLKARLAKANEARALLREALRLHIDVFGGSDHCRDDCVFDTQDGQVDCPQCVASATVDGALAFDAEVGE